MSKKFKNNKNESFEKNDTSNNNETTATKKADTKYYDELFKKIKDQDSEEFNDPEALEILYNNIIEQVSESDSELKKCLNSYHIDYFIYKSSIENFVRILQILTGDSAKLNDYLSDTRISRAYEACLALVGEKIASVKNDGESLTKIKDCLTNLGDYLNENFESIIETQNGIFALRFFLKIIGNEDLVEQTTTQNSNTNKSNKKFQNRQNEFSIKNVQIKLVPSEWKLSKYLKKFSKKLDDLNVLEIGLIASVSPCISLLLRKLSTTYPETCSQIIDNIHKNFVKKSIAFHSMIQDSIGSRFIESFLFACPVDLLADHYFSQHLQPNIVTYCKHIYANYPIQTLVKHRIKDEPKLKILFDCLLENIDSIFDLHTDLTFKHYLIVELIDAAQKSSHLSLDNLINKLMGYFGCESDEDKLNFLKILLIFEKLEDIKKETTIDAALFSFDLKPIASTIATKLMYCDNKSINKSFNNLNANDLEYLCTNNVGSHFIQECLRMFSEKDRTVWIQSFLDKMKGRYLNLCTNRSGSFVIETIWSISTFKQRLAIADELKPSEPQLKNDQFGRFFVNKVGLGFYKRKPEEWKQIQTNEFKKKKMLSEIIDDKTNTNNKKMKK